jgi:hypothetical protein
MMKCLTLGSVLAVAMASAGCMSYSSTTRTAPAPGYSYSSSPGYAYSYTTTTTSAGSSPNAAYTPQYSNETPASRYEYNSQGDYYRNYGGTYHPGPERNCPGC